MLRAAGGHADGGRYVTLGSVQEFEFPQTPTAARRSVGKRAIQSLPIRRVKFPSPEVVSAERSQKLVKTHGMKPI